MPYSLLGFFAGFAIARSTDPALEGSQAAKVAFIPGILGPGIAPLLIAKVVADQEAESLRPAIGVAPAIAVEPPSHNYDKVNVNSSACKIFVVRNTGTADLAVTATTLQTDGEFAIVSGEVSSDLLTLAPGEFHFVEVSFKPHSVGEEKTASLDINSNDPGQRKVTIQLKGIGKERPLS